MNNIKIYSDGAYSPLRKQIGIGIVILKDDKMILKYSKGYVGGSNNQAELGAVIVALRCIKNSINSLEIVTDSQYVIGCATLGWKRKKNQVLWKEFDKQFERVKSLCATDIVFTHTRGHQTDDSENTYWNNECDRLAQQASQALL